MARILQYIMVEFDGAPVIRALTIRFPCLFAGLRATRSQLPEITRQVLCCRIGRDERQGLEIIEVSRSRSAAERWKKPCVFNNLGWCLSVGFDSLLSCRIYSPFYHVGVKHEEYPPVSRYRALCNDSRYLHASHVFFNDFR